MTADRRCPGEQDRSQILHRIEDSQTLVVWLHDRESLGNKMDMFIKRNIDHFTLDDLDLESLVANAIVINIEDGKRTLFLSTIYNHQI